MLGALTVYDADGRPVQIGGARLRTLLLRLALDAGHTVTADALVDAVWPDAPPAGAGNALQALVSRLRRALPEPAALAAVPGGYRLSGCARDVDEFERLAAAGRAAGDPRHAVELFDAAVALWRGPALAEVADAPFARASAVRLEELRLAVTEDRIEATLSCGRAAEAVAELIALTSRYPLRERPCALLMRALSDEVPAAVLEALRPARIRLDTLAPHDPLDRLLAALGGAGALLLLLDNCEHLVAASAHLAEQVLGACPGVRILATSREPLALTGEVLAPVGPLPAPPAGNGADPLDFAAVRLFADRAAAVRPGFAVTAANAAPVGEVCRRLDGLPLAIELATARLRTLPVEQIAARLGDRFRLLSGGSRTALPRHQTLQAVVDWSWDLLDEAEQRLARRLSVFLDGATLEAAEAVCGGDLDVLGALVDKSFVTLGDDGRYRMLETIRAYAAERLAEAGEAEATRDAHARYLLELVEAAEPHLRRHEQLIWLDRVTAERDNLAAALRWAVDRGDTATAVGLGGAAGWYWALRNHHAEAVDWLGQALALPGEVPPVTRAAALAHYALNLLAVDQYDRAREVYAEAAALGAGDHPLVPLFPLLDAVFHNDREHVADALPAVLAHPDPWTRAIGLGVRGRWRLEGGDLAGAERDCAEAIEALRELGDRWGLAIMLGTVAEQSALRGEHERAIEVLVEAVALAEELRVEEDLLLARYGLALQRAEIGDLAGARADLDRAALASTNTPEMRRFVMTLGDADLARMSDQPDRAVAAYHQALELIPRVGGLPTEIRPLILLNLARAVLAAGDADQARRPLDEIRELPENRLILANLAEVSAALAVAENEPDRAARLLGCAKVFRGIPNRGSREVAATTAAARFALGPERYEREYAAGAAYSVDKARAELGAQVLRR